MTGSSDWIFIPKRKKININRNFFLFFSVVQPPPVVTVVPLSVQSVRVTWQPVDKVLLYRITVTDANGTQILSSIISTTSQEVQNLLPCNLYLIAVSSINTFLNPGEPKLVNYSANSTWMIGSGSGSGSGSDA